VTLSGRRLEDARNTYQQVLLLDPRNSVALALLGVVFHLMGDIDKAIVKYHEVHKLYTYSGNIVHPSPRL
jgi:anaphase-promoting complex subunit 6